MIDKLLLAVDGSDRANRAAALAGELEAFADAESLTRTQVFDAILANARADAEGAGASDIATEVGDGDPAEAILAAARKTGAGLIVMGSHGYDALSELALGSVSHEVERGAAIPCLVTH